MYGINNPNGLTYVSNIDGDMTGKLSAYDAALIITQEGGGSQASSAQTITRDIFKGDAVIINKEVGGVESFHSDVSNENGDLVLTAQTTPILGVFDSCSYTNLQGEEVRTTFLTKETGIKPNTSVKFYIYDDPTAIFYIQASNYENALADPKVFGRIPALPLVVNTTANDIAAATFATDLGIIGVGANFRLRQGGGTNFNTTLLTTYTTTATSEASSDGSLNGSSIVVGDSTYVGNYANNPTAAEIKSRGYSGCYLDVSSSDNAKTNSGEYDHKAESLPLKLVNFPHLVNYNKSQNSKLGVYIENVNPTAYFKQQWLYLGDPAKALYINTIPFMTYQVQINNHVYKPGTAGITK